MRYLVLNLEHLDKWTEGRRHAAKKYYEFLKDFPSITLPKEMDYAKHVYHLFVIQVNEGGIKRRDDLAKFLNENGVSTGLALPNTITFTALFQRFGIQER